MRNILKLFSREVPEVPAIERNISDQVRSKEEAQAKNDFYLSMILGVKSANKNLVDGKSIPPWEQVMFYVGALEERVKKLEDEHEKH